MIIGKVIVWHSEQKKLEILAGINHGTKMKKCIYIRTLSALVIRGVSNQIRRCIRLDNFLGKLG